MGNRSMLTWTALVAGANIAAIGGLYLAIPQNGFTTSAPTPTPSSNVTPTKESPKLEPVPQNIPAEKVTSELLKKFPTPKNAVFTVNEVGTPGLTLDVICPREKPLVATVTKSGSISNKTGSGISVQTRAYPAGMGSAAIEAIRQQINKCGGAYEITNTQIGNESVTFQDNESPAGGGPSGKTTVFRRGDVVGVIATRDFADPEKLANEWNTKWDTTLTTKVCPGIKNNDSSKRNPLSENYTGWQRTKQVILGEEETIAANTATLLALRMDATSGPAVKTSTLPKNPGRTLTDNANLNLPWYPDTLEVTLPERPELKTKPVFPGSPDNIASATFTVEDPIGPGCGWKFTGMTAPTFNKKTETTKAEASRNEAVTKLASSYTSWGLARWSYLQSYTKYAQSVKKQQKWVKDATLTIATAWWNDYDKKRETYDTDYAKWQAEYTQWEIDNATCVNTAPSPSPQPTPPAPAPSPSGTPGPQPVPSETVTPTPQPPTPECPAAPTPPEKPKRPKLPRPA